MIKITIKNPDLVQKRQKQICRSALKVFRKKGFHATSMREIAKSTRISLGNLYDYIEKKEAILFLVHKDILGQISRHFDETARNFKNPIEQLVNVIREIAKLSSQLREEVLSILALRGWNILPRHTEEEFIDELIRITLRGLGVKEA